TIERTTGLAALPVAVEVDLAAGDAAQAAGHAGATTGGPTPARPGVRAAGAPRRHGRVCSAAPAALRQHQPRYAEPGLRRRQCPARLLLRRRAVGGRRGGDGRDRSAQSHGGPHPATGLLDRGVGLRIDRHPPGAAHRPARADRRPLLTGAGQDQTGVPGGRVRRAAVRRGGAPVSRGCRVRVAVRRAGPPPGWPPRAAVAAAPPACRCGAPFRRAAPPTRLPRPPGAASPPPPRPGGWTTTGRPRPGVPSPARSAAAGRTRWRRPPRLAPPAAPAPSPRRTAAPAPLRPAPVRRRG